METTKKTPRFIIRFVAFVWVMFFLIVGACALLFAAIAKGWIGYMPPIEDLENPNYKFASEVISSDNKVLGTYSLSKENRVYVGYDQLPEQLIQALIATEDIRFYDHSGIDYRSLARAVVKRGIMHQKNAGGGSTITQQLSKQLYSPPADNMMERLLQKPIEWVIAVKLERCYTKNEILTLYLNKYDWGYSAVGIRNAAMTYFSKEPADLSLNEAATLVGMCQNSSLFNPVRRNELTQKRRNVVLVQMEKAGYITGAQCDSLQRMPLTLNFHPVTHKDGLATYFREYLRLMMTAKEPKRGNYASWQDQNFYEDSLAWMTNPLYGWCNKNTKKNGENYNLYTDGLKIYTTIDSRMQQYAEDAVEEHVGNYLQPAFFNDQKGKKNAPYTNLTTDQVEQALERSIRHSDRYRLMKKANRSDAEIKTAFHRKEAMSVFTWKGVKDTVMTPFDSIRYYKYYLRSGVVSMDPKTGAVKAYVGGPDYKFFQYDMAMRGRRQVGSTMKPFVYSLAMEHGMTPCDQVINQPYSIGTWSPRNSSSSRIGDLVDLRWGLQQSNNWITAYLMTRLSPFELVNLVHSFGVVNRNLYPSPALSLGSCEISVAEMASAYTAFVNKGLRSAPLLVTKVEDANGNEIASFAPQMNEVISDKSAQNMLSMLVAVVNGGTGSRVGRYISRTNVGGKTGTTQNNSDGWFVGFTPSLVTAVWVGGEDRDIHFRSMAMGQGASMALPVWGIYMKKVIADGNLPYNEKETFAGGVKSECTSDSILIEYPSGLDGNSAMDIVIEN